MKSFIFALIVVVAFITSSVFGQSPVAESSFVIDVPNVTLNQDNPSVSINRKNKSLIVIGAASDFTDMDNNGMPVYTSTDRGSSWSSSRLPMPLNPDFYIYGESSATCDYKGNFYYAYITNDGVDSGGTISIAASSDGKNWKNATPINNNIVNPGHPDGVFITVDNSPASPHYGRVYAVWDQFFSDELLFLQEGVTISWSDNQCKTWSTPKYLGSSDDYQMCRTGKNGEIYVSCSDSLGLGHELFVSVDGGANFTDPAQTISFGFFNSYPFFSFGPDSGYTGLKGALGFAAYPYVSFDVDLGTNRIHAVFGDYQNEVATQFYSYSDNNGKDWSDPHTVGTTESDTTTTDCFDPSVSFDQKTGEAFVLYYSSSTDTNNILTAASRVPLTGANAGAPQIIGSPFNPLIVEKTSTASPYIGDHTSSDAFDSIYIGTWTQNRNTFTDADIFAYVSYPNPSQNSVQTPVMIYSPKPWLSAPYPNPSNGKTFSLSYYLPHEMHIVIDLIDVAGKSVRYLEDRIIEEGTFTKEYGLGNIPAGSYIIRMRTDNWQGSRKLIIASD
jgi:hypothetical protein